MLQETNSNSSVIGRKQFHNCWQHLNIYARKIPTSDYYKPKNKITTSKGYMKSTKKVRPSHWILRLKARHPFSTMQSKQVQLLNQIQEQKLIKEVTVETRRKDYNLILKRSIIYFKVEKTQNSETHTFFSTIWRGSCSAKFGSLRKKVSFSTLSFRFRISMKCIVSTSLFWKYSANPIVAVLSQIRKN